MATVTSPRSKNPALLPNLPVAAMPQDVLENGWPPFWWVGCHGGAGVSTLATLTGLGAEMGPAWPHVPADWRIQSAVLVTRASAAGIRAASGAVEQWRSKRGVGNVRLLGLVVVAASGKRPPKIVTERLQLLSGWLPKTIWRIGWIEALLAADNPMDVGVPPDVQALRHGLDRVLQNVETGAPR